MPIFASDALVLRTYKMGETSKVVVLLSRSLGNSTGALPFTAVFDAQGRIVQRKLGETSYTELNGWTQRF